MPDERGSKKTLASVLTKSFSAGAAALTFGAVVTLDVSSAQANIASTDVDSYAVGIAQTFLADRAENGGAPGLPQGLNLDDQAMKAFLTRARDKDLMRLRVANGKAY